MLTDDPFRTLHGVYDSDTSESVITINNDGFLVRGIAYSVLYIELVIRYTNIDF